MGINELPLATMRTINGKFDDDVSDIWSFERSVEQYQAAGGTSLSAVKDQIAFLKDFVVSRSSGVRTWNQSPRISNCFPRVKSSTQPATIKKKVSKLLFHLVVFFLSRAHCWGFEMINEFEAIEVPSKV